MDDPRAAGDSCAVLALGVGPALADDDDVVTFSIGGTPSLTATYAGGKVVASWRFPPGQTEMTSSSILWSTENATKPPSGNKYDGTEGDALTCFLTNTHAPGGYGCTGGSDLGATNSYTISGLAPGTYYVQVLARGRKDESINGNSFKTDYDAWSNVVKVVVTASGGGTTTTKSGGGGGTTTNGGGLTSSATVTVSRTVTVERNDGSKVQVSASSVTLDYVDLIRAHSRAVKLATREGRLVLAPHTGIDWEDYSPGGAATWGVVGTGSNAGEAWFQVRGGPAQHRLLVNVGALVVRTIGPATFVVHTDKKDRNDSVKVLAGKVKVKVELEAEKTLTAGFETFAEGVGSQNPTLTPPKRFKVPPKPFWQ